MITKVAILLMGSMPAFVDNSNANYVHNPALKSKLGGAINTIVNRVDSASVIETVDLGSISGQVKPNIIKIGIHSFSA